MTRHQAAGRGPCRSREMRRQTPRRGQKKCVRVCTSVGARLHLTHDPVCRCYTRNVDVDDDDDDDSEQVWT